MIADRGNVLAVGRGWGAASRRRGAPVRASLVAAVSSVVCRARDMTHPSHAGESAATRRATEQGPQRVLLQEERILQAHKYKEVGQG